MNIDNQNVESPVLSFKIVENFNEFKEKLEKSMEQGIIHRLVNASGFDNKKVSSNFIDVSSFHDYYDDVEQYGYSVKINEDSVILDSYNLFFNGFDGEHIGDGAADEHNIVTIKSNENGECTVSGDIHILHGLKEQLSIYTAVRNEMTYIPDSLIMAYGNGHTEKCDDSQLLEDEKYKIHSLQDYKDKYRSIYGSNRNLQKFKQENAWKNFGVQQDIAKARKRVMEHLKQNEKMTSDIQSGIAKTKDSGYGYVSEDDRRAEYQAKLGIQDMKNAKDGLAK